MQLDDTDIPHFSSVVNGKSTSYIDVRDRGLHYGDGVFDTMAVANGKVLCWYEHIKRLEKGCKQLNIKFPNVSDIEEDLKILLNKYGYERDDLAVLKIIITRGFSTRGYSIPKQASPNRILTLYPWAPNMALRTGGETTWGGEVMLCKSYLSLHPSLSGIKHLSRIEQIMGAMEHARYPWMQECVLLDQQGYIIEGISSNVFFIKGTQLLTPDLRQQGILGIVRSKIIALAPELGLMCQIKKLNKEDIKDTEEMFLSNSIKGIESVRKFVHMQYSQKLWADRFRDELTKRNVIVPTKRH